MKPSILLLMLAAGGAIAGPSHGGGPAAAVPPPDPASPADTSATRPAVADSGRIQFRFTPVEDDSAFADETAIEFDVEDEWLRAPFGDGLITDPDLWRSRRAWNHGHGEHSDSRLELVYNRVDRVRLGFGVEVQDPETLMPRFGAEASYATDRKRWLYGVQLEQPIASPGRVAVGVAMVRRTDFSPLHQVGDVENTLALLFGRQDYRDYFEREGFGAYALWRVPDFSTISAHLRNDDYRSLSEFPNTRSWFNRDSPLRVNPAIDDGRAQTVIARLERLAHRTSLTRAGLYHWIEVEWAGQGLGGDFDYTRALADMRSVIRLTPVSTVSVRMVGGHTFQGTLPRQKQFTAGGVDGLRAQRFARFRGDQMALGQAEVQVEIGRIGHPSGPGGLNAIVFVDVGRAWTSPDNTYDIGDRTMQTDAGFGIATEDNGLRVYFARDLRDSDAGFLVSMRLQRPF